VPATIPPYLDEVFKACGLNSRFTMLKFGADQYFSKVWTRVAPRSLAAAAGNALRSPHKPLAARDAARRSSLTHVGARNPAAV